jgi:H+-translocating NAD(P) transhydrogenase subunit beta
MPEITENVSLFKVLLDITYLIASIAFIVGLKMQSSPDTARKGNFVAASGMGLATLATIVFIGVDKDAHVINYAVVFGGLAAGAFIGSYLAKNVKMTGMPEMVSLLNGFGGATSLLLAMNEYFHLANPANDFSLEAAGSLVKGSLFLGLLIGGVTFTGSVIAWGKLQGKIKDLNLPGQQFINIAMLIGVLMLGALLVLDNEPSWPIFSAIIGIALIYGYFFVMPIGGADMPVVIALLNSFSGIAAIFAGFLVDNNAMIIGGILVGSSGTILSVMMCNAMNRSLMNVLIGNFGGSAGGASAATGDQTHKEVSATDAAIMCNYAQKVIIVPGYGMAVAQAQHAVHGVDKMLEANGVEVLYAIHPVAGRMPGHMNVLLAEADVPYDKLLELEPANEQFKNADVVLIIGANDVVNPAANEEPNSPIYGMPVLNVYEAKNVIVFKRSMKPGYAGIENPLFFKPNTSMLFGDAKAMIEKLGQEIKNL